MKIFFHTFGCRVNQYETAVVRERMLADTNLVVSDWQFADLCVVNTCTVTRAADQDALRLVRRIARRNPAARLVVTGCLATRAPEEIRAAAPHALIVGNDGKALLAETLGCGKQPQSAAAGIRRFGDRSRAYVKVQDGCDIRCTYCIVPAVRPTPASRPCAEALAEARGLLDSGFRELVLCGVRLGRYLSEAGGRRVDFGGLVERLLAVPGDFRVRLSSFEITDVTDRFLEIAAASGDRLCPSFHLPLQSGSDAVLKRMGRWYSADFFARRVEDLKARLPHAGLFTDVMVGFPGETEEDFARTLELVERLGFCGLHIFPYSARAGTPAAAWPAPPRATVQDRLARIRQLDARLRRAFAARALGSRRRVLVETGPDGSGAPTRGAGAPTRGAGAPTRGVEGTAEDFLRVRLDRDPGTGLAWVRIVRVEGDVAEGVVE